MPPLPPTTPPARIHPPPPKLRVAQIRILKALLTVDGGGPLKKSVIAKIVTQEHPTAVNFAAWMAEALGTVDPARRKSLEAKHYPSLMSLGYITLVELDIDGVPENGYTITDEGRKALAAILAKNPNAHL